MSLKDDPPTLDLSDFRSPRVVLAVATLFFKTMLWVALVMRTPPLLGYFLGAWLYR